MRDRTINHTYKSFEGVVLKIIGHSGDDIIVECLDDGTNLDWAVGQKTISSDEWQPGYWTFFPMKSENFNNLYEKLCGE